LAQKFIRDKEALGLAMIPLFSMWDIRRCNVEGCTDKPTTIGTDDELEITFGLCEQHFRETNTPGGASFDLVFDDFDAFEAARRPVAKCYPARVTAGSGNDAC